MPRLNYWAVVVAAVVAFVLSTIWYIGFGSELAKLSAAYADMQTPSPWKMVAEFARSLIVAYMLARFAARLRVDHWKGALSLGAWLWVFPAAILSGAVLHEGQHWMLAAIHAGDWLLKLLVMATIVALWRGKTVATT